nr:hypothetical protein [uncultured Psychroserpens sp.]
MKNLPITTKDIKQSISAAQQITNYAQASVTLAPELENVPSWYTKISADIKQTKSHAQHWLDVLCPATTLHLPRTITSFNPTFQSKISQIQSIVKHVGNGTISDEQRLEIKALFESITTALKVQQGVTSSITNELKGFINNSNADQATLTQDLNIIKSNDLNGATNITEMKGIMTDHFMNNTILGPCNVIVSIDINVSIKINQISSNPNLLAFAFISEFVNHMISNVKALQIPLQSFFDLWNIVLLDYQTVITDLNDASTDNYMGVIEALDLEQTKKDWQAIADFIHQTLPNTNH